MKNEDTPKKFIREFVDDNKKVIARWHYNLDKFPNGPILCENFDLPPKDKKNKPKI